MSIYAIDITFTNPDFTTYHKLYATPTDFLNRFEKLKDRFEKKTLEIRADLRLDDEKKDELIKMETEAYEKERASQPMEESKYVSASVMTGRTHSYMKYGSVAELENYLKRSYDDRKGA